MENQSIIPFEGREIRKVLHNGEIYFSIIDVIAILTDSPQPSSYWNKVKKDILKENESLPIWQRLNLPRTGGKNYPTDCATRKDLLRIIMSVPSPKAEPLRIWLAEQGERTIQETENPELLTERQITLYKAKGYSDAWIKERVQSIETRKRLTDEWKNRGVEEGTEYSILTSTIAKGTFGVSPSEHSDLKGLKNENLRDHMTPMELILTAFSEEATRQIAIRDDAKGFIENHEAAQLGGKIGGEARQNFEKNTGLKVVSEDNFKHLKEKNSEKLKDGKEKKE